MLRSSAWNDELQSMADDLDDVKLRSAERQHQDDHYYLHEDGGGVSGETEVSPPRSLKLLLNLNPSTLTGGEKWSV